MTRLRRVGFAEGVSLLLLVFVAMPLKYLAGQPLAVKVVGWVHGVLFVWFVWELLREGGKRGWPVSKMVLFFFAACVPGGTFVADRSWRREA